MKTVFEQYSLQDEIPVRNYLTKKKLAKYFNRESAAAIVCAGKLLDGMKLSSLTPFYYARGVVEFEDYGLERIVASCRDESGDFSQERFAADGISSISPLTQFKILYNMPECFISIEHNLTGDNAVIYTSAEGLLACALTARQEEILLGAGKVYADGTVAAGFALVAKEEAKASPFLRSQEEAIEIFRYWHCRHTSSGGRKNTPLRKQRVVITGAGVVSPIGSGVNQFMENFRKGIIGVGNIENFDTRFFPVRTAAEAKKDGAVIRTALAVDRKDSFIKTAVDELMQAKNIDPETTAIHLGTGIDYFDLVSYVGSNDAEKGKWQPYCPHAHASVNQLAEQYKIKGGHSANVAACAASTQAMGLAFRLIRDGRKDAVITGGYDSMLCHLHYMGFYKLGALSDWSGEPSKACRPFDKNRRGLVLGEGAAAFLLENIERVDPDKILAEIVGYSATMDAHMVTEPHPDGKYLAAAAEEAIAEAGISPDEIDCVHLHGTGTIKNDPAEARAMELVFGQRFKEIPVFSLKGHIGHLIGACGAMEMLGVLYSLQKQEVPPAVNFETPDPDVPLRVVKNEPLKMRIQYILKLNSSFGGQNTAFVVRKYEKDSDYRGKF
ncbi:MAG TPA: beta-ketoacyl-[acyl-carrier-protein] synthase family protein [Methylomicrobium sp.]|nr:beta-ketoacyl-[acyl-carrier-protein] synthase family protein [Methylomicrobium sp.]